VKKTTIAYILRLVIIKNFCCVRNEDGVALYLTDWTADNFAVDSNGRVVLIDGENFVLVDQHLVNKTAGPGWNVAHTSDGFGCHSSFCYSSEDLCTHIESDHNLYGVCKVSMGTCHL
jgi:hypothetical protein